MKKPQIVEVEWLDARTVYEQMTLTEAMRKVRLSKRYSVGYLIQRSKEEVLIAATFDPAEESTSPLAEDEGADYTIIPKAWVQRIRTLSDSGTVTTTSTEN